jgi:nucleolysin TIA-1/TIAR
LAPDIDQQTLREAFAPFGEISDVKIMKDPHTMVHKGYGFISFVNKVDAESAIAQMNGQWLGTRKIRTNWATRKIQPGGGETMSSAPMPNKYVNKLDYNEVWSRSSDTNTTVYCGGLTNISEELIRQTFAMYGQIIGVHPFPDRGYAFVRFATKEAACNAICGVHGMEINGGVAKCSWGKENIDMTTGATQSASSLAMGSSLYANANSSSLATAAALAAAAAQNAGSLPTQLGGGGAGSNPWNSGANTQNTNWAAANYQWTGYPQNTMNYWQGYPGYQNAMMQGWGVMPAATAAGNTATNAQYQLGQYQQGTNGKS